MHDVATHAGIEVASAKSYISEMLSEGYFENASLKGGLLVTGGPISCRYCKSKIPPEEKKCPNCGAPVKV